MTWDNPFMLAGIGFTLIGISLTGWLLYSARRFKDSVYREFDPPEEDNDRR